MRDELIAWSDFRAVGREEEYLLDAFRSGWVSGGPYVEKLESLAGQIFPGSAAYCVANGTLALQLAFQAIGVGPGTEVIVPAFCFQAGANVLKQLGAVPVFCDIDPLTWNQSVETLERAWTPRVVGVLVVHNYGSSAPAGEIAQWAASKGLWMIEDCAEAWFSKYRGRYLGQYGVLSTFSMHATKPIACGEGGMLLSNDQNLHETLRLLRSHGLDRQRTHYLHLLAGNNYRLSNLLAAIACAQLERREAISAQQASRCRWYAEFLAGHWACQFQHGLTDAEDLLWAVAVRVPVRLLSVDRNGILERLRERGIEARPGFYSASHLAYHNFAKGACPVAESVSESVVVLPCSPLLGRAEVQSICRTFIGILDDAARDVRKLHVAVLPKSEDSVRRVKSFDQHLSSSKESFRYFKNRPYEAVSQQLCTLMLSNDGADIGYGHLETEAGVTWLGIALADRELGRGWGRILMQRLIEEASVRGVAELSLRVDRDNARGIRLYEQYGFAQCPEPSPSASLLMRKKVERSRALSHISR
jgi:perosamine synthetase